MTKKLLTSIATLLLFASLSVVRAQTTNAMAGMTNMPAADTNAPAASTANNDPGGGTTGVASDATGAAGAYSYAAGLISARPRLTGDDLKDTNKVAAYNDAKKAFDDYTAQAAKEPLAVKLADAVGHNRIAINFVWTLVTGFLVMFMQAGFALVETGLCRAKNAAHTMTMNFMIYPLGMLGFYVCGFAFMFGGVGAPGAGTLGGYRQLEPRMDIHLFGHDWGIIGLKGFFLGGCWKGDTYDAGIFCLFLFQMVFMDTTATIPTGGAAERWKFSAFMLYGCFIGTVMYPVFGNWVWGGGWLSQLGVNFGLGHGHVDFAGSSVVHMQGGVICLDLLLAHRPAHRQIQQGRQHQPDPAAQHSDGDSRHVHSGLRLVRVQPRLDPRRHGPPHRGRRHQHHAGLRHRLLGRDVSGCGGARANRIPAWPATACWPAWWPSPVPARSWTRSARALLGLIAGLLVVESVFFFDKIGIDDCVGAISVHGV